ncbi:alpha-amylase family glycosyl hydrolase [Anaerorhabdus sp.]|uniref:alpha-amylase family glycosyl hydrolase n=1 Tax=Anaerorhabdus sp. TaxID=1872524 RepID=UPI002FCB0430
MWFENSIFYQIYTLGFCGAPHTNDGIQVSRLNDIIKWIPHLKQCNIDAIYFTPIFESDSHGYDTRDYQKIDCRLGTNEDFKIVTQHLKDNNIRIVLDGVFNHVGRGFWAFQDVLQHRYDSLYKDWFHINFDGNSPYNDEFYYEGWEGHYELVKLNLKNPDVVHYLLESIRLWIDEFDIDGIRLDVAYCIEPDFLKTIRTFCTEIKGDFFLVGEIISGDYSRIVNQEMLHSCTNYECFKGIHSSLNDLNLFEIAHSLNRQFSNDPYSLYKNMHLLSFVDNHDVSRIASNLKNKNHLPLAYGLLFSMPGIPCLYYGSEWGIEGLKQKGSDDNLRPHIEYPVFNELAEIVAKLTEIHKSTKAIIYGDYKNVTILNKQLVYQRSFEDESILVVFNIDQSTYTLSPSQLGSYSEAIDLISGDTVILSSSITLQPYSMYYLKITK